MFLKEGTILQNGKYRIDRVIGSGGFGCTYEGEHTMLGSRVAIKEFFVSDICKRHRSGRVSVAIKNKNELINKLSLLFVKEARALFTMNHPNIVRVTDIFEQNNTSYYVMDYIEGQSLSQILQQRGPLPEQEVVSYARQIAMALRYVHGKNRMHLDVKPANIMINNEGHAILIDFGASKHYNEETGEASTGLDGIRTEGYSPLEQSTQSLTSFCPASDIYSLGATMYKLLTGETPPSAISLAEGSERLAPMPPYITAQTANAVYCAMRLNRNDRPQDIDSFLRLLTTPPTPVFHRANMPPIPSVQIAQRKPQGYEDEVPVAKVERSKPPKPITNRQPDAKAEPARENTNPEPEVDPGEILEVFVVQEKKPPVPPPIPKQKQTAGNNSQPLPGKGIRRIK